MKLWLLVISLIIYGLAARSPQVVSANGNTSSDANPGQVRASAQEDGTLYLTTQVNPGGQQSLAASSNAPSRPRLTTSEATGEVLYKPQGFAENLGSYLNSVLGIVMVISLLLAFLNFITAGIQWITSGGDKGKTEEARNKIVHSVIGILIVSSSFALVGFVAYVLGFDSINDALSHVKRINPS